MQLRRLIPITLAIPLLLCIFAWPWSAAHWYKVLHIHAGAYVEFATSHGTVSIAWGSSPQPDTLFVGGNSMPSHLLKVPDNYDYAIPPLSLVGLGYATEGTLIHIVFIPYWLLLILFSLTLWLGWQKTKPNPSRAFLIEIASH